MQHRLRGSEHPGIYSTQHTLVTLGQGKTHRELVSILEAYLQRESLTSGSRARGKSSSVSSQEFSTSAPPQQYSTHYFSNPLDQDPSLTVLERAHVSRVNVLLKSFTYEGMPTPDNLFSVRQLRSSLSSSFKQELGFTTVELDSNVRFSSPVAEPPPPWSDAAFEAATKPDYIQ